MNSWLYPDEETETNQERTTNTPERIIARLNQMYQDLAAMKPDSPDSRDMLRRIEAYEEKYKDYVK